jgi:cytochrome c oxidase subunit 2
MTTEDVLHDFYVPAFRHENGSWFPDATRRSGSRPTKPGKYHLFCAEYCGLNHSGMGGYVYVMEQSDFDNWLAGSVSVKRRCKPDRTCSKQTRLRVVSRAGQISAARPSRDIYGEEIKRRTGKPSSPTTSIIRNSI